MYDIMDLTESMVEGMVKYLTGGRMTVDYYTDSKEAEDGKAPKIWILEFRRLWKRYDMIKTLEKLSIKFPPGETLHTDETNNAFNDTIFIQRSSPAPGLTCQPGSRAIPTPLCKAEAG